MASLGLPAFESPAPRPNKNALHRILESVVTTNERLAGQDDKIPQTSRILPAVPQFAALVPRFRSATASWQDAEDPNMYDVHVPARAASADDASFSGLFSSGALASLLAFSHTLCISSSVVQSWGILQ